MKDLDDKERSRMVGWAEAQINRLDVDHLVALHVAAGEAILRQSGFSDSVAIDGGKQATTELIQILAKGDGVDVPSIDLPKGR